MLGEGKLQGAVIDNLFGMFSYFSTNAAFDFVANILSNVSSLKAGRVYMMKNKMLPMLVDMIKSSTINQHRKDHLTDCIRNMAFEYDNYEKLFIDVSQLPS